MNKFLFTLADERFYVPFETHYKAGKEYIDLVTELSKDAAGQWMITPEGFWVHVHPLDEPASADGSPKPRKLPVQGWKVHVSATLDNDKTVLENAARVAFGQEVAFKFVPDRNILSLTSSKAWPRSRSGKFMTMYPADRERFERLLEALSEALEGQEGPYILSDKRYKDCRVLYYRYGGIQPTTRMEVTGVKTHVLFTPDGEPIPDVRTPYFAPPPWESDPFPAEEDEASEITLQDGRFTVKTALTFSNSGGVYEAVDNETGEEVIVKEARAHTLMDGRGNNAIVLLQREHEILEAIEDAGVAPKPIASFPVWENHFLAQEYLQGKAPREIMLTRSPLMHAQPELEHSQEYYEVFKELFKSFAERLQLLHDRGIVFGDLSHTNVKVDPSDWAVRFMDFEGAYRTDVDTPTFLYTPGFKSEASARSESHGFDEDRYSLAAIMLYMIFPISALASVRDDLYDDVLPIIVGDAGWSRTPVLEIIRGLAEDEITCGEAREMLDRPAPIEPPGYADDFDVATCDEIADKLGRFVLENMRPDAEDSLFPADPFVYQTNPLGLGFGACGTLWALETCGFEVPKAALDWVERRLDDTAAKDFAPGLLTGAAGIAWCLYDLGLEDRAEAMIAVANGSDLAREHHSYLYGMSGLGMANLYLHLRTGNDVYLAAARDLADTLCATAKESEQGLFWDNGEVIHLGLGYGQSGVALFLLRLFETTGDEELLSAGRRALAFDLANGIESETGGLAFPTAPGDVTLLPYLEEGSAGVAKVAIRYGQWDRAEALWPSVHRKYATFVGMLYGLGGFVDALTDAYVLSGEERFLEMAKRPLSGLRDFYLIEQPNGSLATPGEGLFRLTCDYGTGSAGVMRAIYRYARHERADFMLDEIGAQATRVDEVDEVDERRHALST